MKDIVSKKFRHYKGNEYMVLNIVKHSETLEKMVVYQDLSDEKKLWVRPYDMFVGNVEIDGKMVKRFEECK
ncbi:MAG: hypothetical protein A2Y24_02555 [Clostridiales bacterium GWE2_32_10]|nr:MAG: hypothetical protein A2Y24_02555 [Clostridiales bacterium GWE2_32_10]HBY21155.1 DUF1653 domain-containing protein [Clostridiales bacterium]